MGIDYLGFVGYRSKKIEQDYGQSRTSQVNWIDRDVNNNVSAKANSRYHLRNGRKNLTGIGAGEDD